MLLAQASDTALSAINPFIGKADIQAVHDITTGIMASAIRVGHVGRCLYDALELRAELHNTQRLAAAERNSLLVRQSLSLVTRSSV